MKTSSMYLHLLFQTSLVLVPPIQSHNQIGNISLTTDLNSTKVVNLSQPNLKINSNGSKTPSTFRIPVRVLLKHDLILTQFWRAKSDEEIENLQHDL